MKRVQPTLPDNKYCWTLLDDPSTDPAIKAVYRHKHESVWLAIRPVVNQKHHAELFAEETPVDERVLTDAESLLGLLKAWQILSDTVSISICPTPNSTKDAYESAGITSTEH